MTEAAIDLTTDGPVATIVLNRPSKRNALNEAMWRAITARAGEIAIDDTIKVLILRGGDPTAFSAGADIAEFARVHASPRTADAYRQVVSDAYEAIAGLCKPTIALIQGICFGGGCALSLCCDLRYADPSARFCIPPAKLGLVYSFKETKRLADLVGPAKAKEMLMGARVVDAEEAFRVGLVTRLFNGDDLETETLAFARRLSELSGATISAVKIMMAEIADGATAETAISRRLVTGQFESGDYVEGRRAFLEKRKPRFN